MPEVVKVSTVESSQNLMSALEGYFKKGRYAEIAQLIGMHSILIDPQHSMRDQAKLYRSVLTMIKNKTSGQLGKNYGAWYAEFPAIMDSLVTGRQVVTDTLSVELLASHRAAVGPFKSLDDFFFWALDDRKLSLDQIVKYIEKTAESFIR